MLTNMKLEFAYAYTYDVPHENGYIIHHRTETVFRKFIRGKSSAYKLYQFDVHTFLQYCNNVTIFKDYEKMSDTLHYQLFNFATSLTLKGAKKVAMLQGNSRDMMQECDLIEARNNAYASVLTAIKEGQFKQLAQDYTNEYCNSVFNTRLGETVVLSDDAELIINATKKAIASLCYKMINAYTYQLKRDSRHLSVDAMMTDADGNDVPIIETIAHEHIETVQEKKRIQDLLDAMSNKQLKAMYEALNEKQLTRYTKVIDTMLQSKPLTDKDKRFYQRSNNAIQEIYKTL